jgi:ribosomal protein L40E
MLLPVTNSPRSGECGYDGEFDIWTYDPDGPFPQPQKPKRKRGRILILPKEEEVSAEVKWGKIDAIAQKKILESSFCAKCGLTTITDYTFDNSTHDVILHGKCAKCGAKAVRLVEYE